MAAAAARASVTSCPGESLYTILLPDNAEAFKNLFGQKMPVPHWKSASSSGARASLPLPELPTYDAHEGGIIIHKAAKKAFDELALKKLPTVNLLQAEYSDLLVQKKLDYAALAKAREEARQLQIYKANEETRMPRNSGRQGSINRKNSTALQGVAEGEPFDQSGGWGEFPQQAAGRFPSPEISLFVKFV